MADASTATRKTPSARRPKSGAEGPAKALAAAFSASFLPGEHDAIGPAELAEIAAFTMGALKARQPGEAGIVIESMGGTSGKRFMRIALVNDDMPFLVDSVASAIADQGLAVDRLLHPVITVDR